MKIKLTFGAAAALALAGCGSDAPTEEAPAEQANTVSDDMTDIELETPVAAKPADPIRGPGGLEAKCLARVSEEVGGGATSLNHIEESEAAIEIYVNVDGAEAPWKCLGYKDGSIGDVMYTGSEGAA